MLEGSRESERITASPRKMCVPGVHACATEGVSITSSNAASNALPTEAARDEARDIPRALNADALTLPAYRFPEICQLFFDYVVDRITRSVDVIAHLVDDLVDGNAVDQFSTAFNCSAKPSLGAGRGPSCAFYRAITSPSRALESTPPGPPGSLEAGQTGQRRAPPCITRQWPDRTAPRRPAPQQQGDARTDSRTDERRRQKVILLLALIVHSHLWA